MTTEAPEGVTLLGRRVDGAITADQIETFPNPGVAKVVFTTHELTAFCPVTAQPDLYTATIVYRPRALCIESKALKLYLHGFRDRGAFCEALAVVILDALVNALRLGPHPMSVILHQQVRGGLTLSARADHHEGIDP